MNNDVRVWNFAKAILHGDDEHRAWLLEAARAFEAGEPLPAVRGAGTIKRHDPTKGPCPTCEFQIKEMGRAKPIVIEED